MRTEAKKNEKNEYLCPKCVNPLSRLFQDKNIFRCKEHGDFKVTKQRAPKPKDMNDSRNWKATCSECGGVMDYFNLRYGCRKCGHVLEV